MESTKSTNLDYPDYPSNYVPNVVEIHDEQGLLVRISEMEIVEQNYRSPEFQPQIITWLFDGNESENVAYAHTSNTVLINRIGNLNTLSDLTEALSKGGKSS